MAQSLRSLVSRSGPTVALAPAAASVWQDAHPAEPVNTVLPAAALGAAVLDGAAGFAEEAPPLEDAAPPLDVAVPPGTPAWLFDAGGVPIGGAALAGCEANQD